MNTAEAIMAIQEGKKVRHSQWQPHRYLHNVDGVICNEKNCPNPIKSFHDMWELYKEDTRKELPKGLIHTKELYELINSTPFNYCVDVACINCPYSGGIVKNKCSIVQIRDMMNDINKEFKLGELK